MKSWSGVNKEELEDYILQRGASNLKWVLQQKLFLIFLRMLSNIYKKIKPSQGQVCLCSWFVWNGRHYIRFMFLKFDQPFIHAEKFISSTRTRGNYRWTISGDAINDILYINALTC